MKAARSTYYSILNHKASDREIENNTLKSKIFKVYCDNRKVYGCIKITHILREEGYLKLSVNRVSRLMKQLELAQQFCDECIELIREKEFAFLGHCAGSLVGYEAALYLKEKYGLILSKLFFGKHSRT